MSHKIAWRHPGPKPRPEDGVLVLRGETPSGFAVQVKRDAVVKGGFVVGLFYPIGYKTATWGPDVSFPLAGTERQIKDQIQKALDLHVRAVYATARGAS